MSTDKKISRTWKTARALALLAVITQATSACDEATPTAPTSETFTESFSGSLGTGESLSHQFTVRVEGAVAITLISTVLENPPEGTTGIVPALGLAIGTWNGTTCTRVAVNGSAFVGTTISGTSLPGDFCVAVYDSGSIANRVTYTGQVAHH